MQCRLLEPLRFAARPDLCLVFASGMQCVTMTLRGAELPSAIRSHAGFSQQTAWPRASRHHLIRIYGCSRRSSSKSTTGLRHTIAVGWYVPLAAHYTSRAPICQKSACRTGQQQYVRGLLRAILPTCCTVAGCVASGIIGACIRVFA